MSSLKLKRSFKKEQDKREKDIEKQIKDLFEESKALINLTDKILVFLEPPSTEMWGILNPILQPSLSEIEFPFENQNIMDDLQVKKVVIRGNPACIFCVTKDEFKLDVWPNITSQFLISSPNMISQKNQESIKMISPLKGHSNSIEGQTIVSEKEIQLAKECILAVKHIIKKFRCDDNNEISVWIPYSDVVQQEFSYNGGIDMRFKKRILSFLRILLFIRYEQRKLLIIEDDTFVIAELKDLKEVLSVTQNFEIPMHIKEFFEKIFYPPYKEKKKPYCNDDGSKKAEIKSVTIKQLCESYKKVYGKSIDPDILKETYLNELLNKEWIGYQRSVINPSQYIYYSLVEPLLPDIIYPIIDENDNFVYGKESVASKTSDSDQFSHIFNLIYERIDKKTDNRTLYFGLLGLVSSVRNLEKGPIELDYIFDPKTFMIVDNKKSGYNNNSQPRSCNNNSNSGIIEYLSSIENSKDKNNLLQTKRCPCHQEPYYYNHKRLPIIQFIESYTNIPVSESDFKQMIMEQYIDEE